MCIDFNICKKCHIQHNKSWTDKDILFEGLGRVRCCHPKLEEYYEDKYGMDHAPYFCYYIGEHAKLMSENPGKLNKKICKRCCNTQTFPNMKQPKWNEHNKEGSGYEGSSDEDKWGKGIVYCPFSGNENKKGNDYTSIYRMAPYWCPYKLEHIISDNC